MSLSFRDQQVLSFIFEKTAVKTLEDSFKPSPGEIEAIKVAESGDYNLALELINKIALLTPSVLNNKAQILRLLNQDDEAMECLNACLQASPEDCIKRRALAQRGWIHYRRGETDAAFADFEAAAHLGCLESKRMAVRCNPYAKLCHEMMLEMLDPHYFSA